MASVIEAVEIRCPHCGASLYRTKLLPGARRLCPFCGTSFVSGAANMSDAGLRMHCRVIPFITDRKDFEREVLKRLARDNKTPVELFSTLYFVNAEGIYYPSYAYAEGRTDKSNPLMLPAVKDHSSIQEISGYIINTAYDLSRAAQCSGEILERRTFLAADMSPDECLEYYGEGNAPGTVLHHRKGKAELVLVPFWVMTFKYGEHVYRFVMDGTDCSVMMESMPHMPREEKSDDIVRKFSGVLQVLSWLSLILLFWNVYWIPMTLWTLWIVTALVVRLRRITRKRKGK